MKEQEKAIKDIIKKYGDTIDLKKSPYLIAEIIRSYGHFFGNVAGGESGPTPGSHGTPPPRPEPAPTPPPGPQSNPFEKGFIDIRTELTRLAGEIQKLNTKLDTFRK